MNIQRTTTSSVQVGKIVEHPLRTRNEWLVTYGNDELTEQAEIGKVKTLIETKSYGFHCSIEMQDNKINLTNLQEEKTAFEASFSGNVPQTKG